MPDGEVTNRKRNRKLPNKEKVEREGIVANAGAEASESTTGGCEESRRCSHKTMRPETSLGARVRYVGSRL